MGNLTDIIIRQLRRVLPEKLRIGIGILLVMLLGAAQALGAIGVAPEFTELIIKFKDAIILLASGFGVSGGSIMISDQVETNRELARSFNEYARSMQDLTRRLKQ
jgi:hypothetical protein